VVSEKSNYIFDIEIGGSSKIEHKIWTTKVNPLAQKKQNNFWQRDIEKWKIHFDLFSNIFPKDLRKWLIKKSIFP